MSAKQTWLFPTTKVSIIENPPYRGAARTLTWKCACTYEKRYMINIHHLSFVTVFVFSLPKEWTATVSSTTLSSLGWTFLSMGLLCKRGHRAGNRTLSVSTHVMGWWQHARIHTCFHRFTEIGQIFRNRYIFNKEKLSKLQGFILGEWNRPIFCLNDS